MAPARAASTTTIAMASKHQTHLLFDHVWRVDKANERFGQCKDGDTIVILQPGRMPLMPYIRIPDGMYAIVQHHGKDIDFTYPDGRTSPVWPSGFHYASVFTKVAYLVTKQFVVFDTPVKGCKTADDVTVHIDMCLVFRITGDESKGEDPHLVKRFVYELGPQGLETQLRDAQEEAVRALARSVEHTEVYSLRDGTLKERFKNDLQLRPPAPMPAVDEEEKFDENAMDAPLLDRKPTLKYAETGDDDDEMWEQPPAAKVLYCVTEDIKKNLNAQFNPYGVEISSVSITNVLLPANFESQMEEKTTYTSAIKEQNMKQQSDMQLLQYKEEIDTTKLSKYMRRMEETETGKQACAEIQKEIDMIRADTKKIQTQIDQDMQVRCAKIAADADLSIAKLKAETEMIQTEIHAECDAEITKIHAEMEALKLKMAADVARIQAVGEAKAKEIVSEAEGVASGKLEKQRAFLLQMQRLDVTLALAGNKQVVIAGNGSNNLLADVFVAQQKSNLLLNLNSNGNLTTATLA
ncbi:Aste57867_13488 [Aphanomyces stellatus]|uniref:Aste57867_13488 protein n=1 Tax=Aphanomyces stellatus TaxID=120398 RepID=A0A485KYI5_9STRA|nr:hypothetical protein As57867_013438 [Aphanomyces stellatus]KAF0718109.1 hypothetical protein As57867_001888 [Aphanomyces stellatus]VFT79097.1 Aste57867_1890 [Aphanomyces stellatus]VFT90326.1 Aste57867_13488 [Aphanomyces stellatus]